MPDSLRRFLNQAIIDDIITAVNADADYASVASDRKFAIGFSATDDKGFALLMRFNRKKLLEIVQKDAAGPDACAECEYVYSGKSQLLQAILAGSKNPVSAYVSGQLKIRGNIAAGLTRVAELRAFINVAAKVLKKHGILQ